MGNACATDEKKDIKNQDDSQKKEDQPSMKQAKPKLEDNNPVANDEPLPMYVESHDDQHNNKYMNNLQPIDELPEITNPVVRMSIDKHGSYIHQSKYDLEKSMAEEPDLVVKLSKQFENSRFVGTFWFPDEQSLREYKDYGKLDFHNSYKAVGQQVWNDGSYYDGDYAFGKFNGRGRYYHKNGDMYEGEFKDNLAYGKGSFEKMSADGDPDYFKYEGEWEDNLPEGKGIHYNGLGEVYNGEFSRGMKNGYGEQKLIKKYVYNGGFSENKFDGEGQYTYLDDTGRYYKGSFKDGHFHGLGVYSFENGDLYEGGYYNGKKHGHGVLTMNAKGIIYDGEWKDGVQDGEGKIKTIADNKEVVSGIFRNGKVETSS